MPVINELKRISCHLLEDVLYFFFKKLSPKDVFVDFREMKKEGERQEHRSVAYCTCPYWGPNLQPTHVSLPGIELITFRFTGGHTTN